VSLIEIHGLTKLFGAVRAVDDLSFEIQTGTIAGFLGPNGSGKTTTLRSLLGLVTPTAGTATISGHRYGDLADPLREVGVMLEATAHPSRTARKHLRVIAAEARVPRTRVDEVLELVDLQEAADRKVGGFSLGMRQRLGLAGALIGDPAILVLDEPANGLDPEGIRWLRGFLQGLAAEGRTILLSSHVLSEVAQTVDEVVVISSGRLIAHAPLEQLMADGHSGRVRLRSPELARLATVLREGGMKVLAAGGEVLTVTGASQEAIGQLAFDNRIVLHEVSGEGSTLEDVFLNLTTPAEEVEA
jgi:ABC-2 type transport system ATP-binding protein